MKKRSTTLFAVLIIMLVFGATACVPAKPSIKFDSQGGSAVAAITVKAGTDIEKPTDPEREGYRFDGWFSTSDCTGTEYEFTKMPTKTITLYAKWTFLYTITFNTNGAAAIDAIKGAAGETLTMPTNPQKDGYKFDGWYTESSLNTKFSSKVFPEDDITLYAKWIELFTVNYYILDGQDPYLTIHMELADKIYAPTVPVRDGYIFDGWTTNENGLGASVDFTSGITVIRNLNYYGKWTVTDSTLHFDLMGGNVGGETTIADLTILTEDPLATHLKVPTKSGLIFSGWYLDQAMTTRLGATMPGGTNTAYACWVSELAEANLSLLAGGGFASVVQGLTLSRESSGALTIGIASSKENFSCIGRTIYGDLKGLRYTRITITFKGTAGKPVMFKVEGNHTAKETGNINCTGDVQTYTFDLGQENLPAGNDKKTMFLIFWCVSQNASTAGESVLEVTDISFVRFLEETKEVENLLYVNTGTTMAVPPIFFHTGETIVYPDINYAYPGYHVAKYYTDMACTQEFTATTMPVGPVQLFVGWEVNAAGLITFDANGGEEVFDYTYPIGSAITLPTPTYHGYTFNGWVDADGNAVTLKAMPAETVALRATWTVNDTKTLTFVSNGGTDCAAITLPAGSEIDLPSPTKDGYELEGWYSDASLETPFMFFYMPNSNMTVYAKWVGTVDIEVTFVAGEGAAVTPATETGRALQTISIPVPTHSNTGYLFAGWYLEDTFATKFTGAIHETTEGFSVYAKWLEKEVNTKTTLATTGFTSSNSGRLTVNGSTIANAHNTHTYYASKSFVWDSSRPYMSITFTTSAVGVTLRAQLYGTSQIGSNIDLSGNGSTPTTLNILNSTIANGTTVTLRLLVDPTGSGTGKSVTLSEIAFMRGKLVGTADNSAIYFKANGTGAGVVDAPTAFAEIGSTITAPTTLPVYPGHAFTGWFTEAACENAYTFTVIPATPITLYAGWTVNADVTVTFVVNGGTIGTASVTAPAGSAVTLPTATPDGVRTTTFGPDKAFGQWYYDQAFTQPYTGYMPDADATLYARWKVHGNVLDLRPLLINPGLCDMTRNADGSVLYTMTEDNTGWANGSFTFAYNSATHLGIHVAGTFTGNVGFLIKPGDNFDFWVNPGIETADAAITASNFTAKGNMIVLFAGPNGGTAGNTYLFTEFYIVGWVLE